jgi:chromosome segregation ATPase
VTEKKTAPAGSGESTNTIMNIKKLGVMLGLVSADSAEEMTSEQMEQTLEAAEQRVQELTTQLATATERIGELVAIVEQHEADAQVAERNAEGLQAQITELQAELDKAPLGQATTALHSGNEDAREADHRNTSVDKEKEELMARLQ